MLKYKVGDKVKIRKDLKVGKLYGTCFFTEGMKDLRGKITRITKVNRMGYRIDSRSYYWTDEMFEDVDVETQGMDKRVAINVEGNKVVARCGDKKGVARCHPDDDFDFYIGAKIALERLKDAENPYAWLKDGMQYFVPDTYCKDLYYKLTYRADSWGKRVIKLGIAFKTKEEAIACTKKMLAAVKQKG